MLKYLDYYMDGNINLTKLVETLLPLFGIIEDTEKTSEFIKGFWDSFLVLDEINAVNIVFNKEGNHQEEIKKEIIPKLKALIKNYIIDTDEP